MLAFGLASAGLSSAFEVRCSVAVRATVLAGAHPIGPIGPSAEFSAVPSETTVAVAYSLRGTCWAAGRIYFEVGATPVDRAGLRSRPKSVAFNEGATHARHMQKRANSARAGRTPAKRVVVGMTLAFGLASAGLSSAFEVRCSVAVRATVLAGAHPIGPIGPSAEFSAVVGRGGRQQGPQRLNEKRPLQIGYRAEGHQSSVA